MQTISSGYRSLSLLIDLNWDRLVSVGLIIAGLLVGSYLANVVAPL